MTTLRTMHPARTRIHGYPRKISVFALPTIEEIVTIVESMY